MGLKIFTQRHFSMYLMCLCVYLIGRTGFYNTQKQTSALRLCRTSGLVAGNVAAGQGPASHGVLKDIECMSSRSETLLNHNKVKSAMHGTFFYVAESLVPPKKEGGPANPSVADAGRLRPC
jgi:hypothetical protein